MKITNLKWIVVLGIIVILSSACSSAPAATPPATRAPTQTPWIIYVPVTSTPEPAIATVLPAATASGPTKVPPTPTRTAVSSVKASSSSVKVAPTATKAPVAVVSATPVPPACTASAVTLLFPENGTIRKTKRNGPASDTFVFKFTPTQQGETDPQLGYHIEITSKAGNRVLNGDVVDIQHNWFWNNGQQYIYDAQRVWGLGVGAPGDTVTVTWTVTVIKTTGGFDNKGRASGPVVNCSPASSPSVINLSIMDTGS